MDADIDLADHHESPMGVIRLEVAYRQIAVHLHAHYAHTAPSAKVGGAEFERECHHDHAPGLSILLAGIERGLA